jgi:CRISPR-associated protein Csx14
MTRLQPSFTVDVDTRNPAQFFACCGVLEIAQRLWPKQEVCAWFADGSFEVSVLGNGAEALQTLLETLRATEISVKETQGERALRPVLVQAIRLSLDWWADARGSKSYLKLWAGQQTSLGIVKALRDALPKYADSGLLNAARPLTGRFGVDPRSAWSAFDVGFSPNSQEIEVATYPAAELLGAIGLQRFRPVQDVATRPVRLRYSTWSIPLPPCVARAASARLLPAGSVGSYRFRIADRGSYKGFDYAIPVGGAS